MYAALGERELLFVFDFPGIEQAAQASIALTKMMGISFSKSPALSVEQFETLTAGI